MVFEGGCFCGAVRYRAEGDPVLKGQCHCRQCQHFAGGGPNIFLAMPKGGFSYIEGAPRSYARKNPPMFEATREFCPMCGVQLVTHAAPLPDIVFVKVGTLDDPASYGGPKMAIFMAERQPFHCIAEGLPTFDKMPPM